MEVQTQLQMDLSSISTSGRAYLDELEKDARSYSKQNPTDERWPNWADQKKIYGFDETETWNLNSTFYAWLYEHLRMYTDKANKIVNLHFHKFEWNGKEYYQDEIIDMILDHIRFFFSEDYDDFSEENIMYIEEIGELWALVLPAMWW